MRKSPLAGFVFVTLALGVRHAAAHRRPIFEPTDLEMEHTGILEVDLQLGMLQGEDAWRAAVPDVEMDIGIAPGAELDIDATYAIEGPNDGSFSFERASPDNVWFAAKLALFDDVDDGDQTGWAFGTQLGPKFPVARDAHGMGYEGLLLAARHWGNEAHLVFNLGGFVDPGAAISSQRHTGIEGGLDLNVGLRGTRFSLTGELAGVRFLSPDPHQLHATAGITWSTTEMIDVSLVGLLGFLRGGDRSGVLLGFSPKFAVWK